MKYIERQGKRHMRMCKVKWDICKVVSNEKGSLS